jgi:hypothetical protein
VRKRLIRASLPEHFGAQRGAGAGVWGGLTASAPRCHVPRYAPKATPSYTPRTRATDGATDALTWGLV